MFYTTYLANKIGNVLEPEVIDEQLENFIHGEKKTTSITL
jgi:hypothetical protein